MDPRLDLRSPEDDNESVDNMKTYYVYIMASKKHGTLYVGVTGNIQRRTWQHRNNIGGGFTSQYDVTRLVHIEQCCDVISAIEREKKLKKWKRQYKINLIEKENPEWIDLYEGMFV